MIALSSTVAKIFHQILAQRVEDFVIQNSYIDSSLQKGFLQGISGCTDHNTVIHEIIKHAKSSHRTVHFTWFDMEDAFGSVPHSLIDFSMSRYGIPKPVHSYIMNLYSSLTGFVSTQQWQSEPFKFKKGIFQGDPLSPLIFLMCFNPMIEFLSQNDSYGYNLNGTNFITAPYADDFCLITGNKRMHQRLINQISAHTQSLGLKLKPGKCKSLSISRGSPTDIPFMLDDYEIQTLRECDFKFLGSLVTFRNSTSDIFKYVEEIITSGIEKIDMSLVRNEYKMKIYSDYFLSSIRYHLTVNELSESHLKSLDALTNRYLKRWSGLPKPATLAFLHMPEFLNIPTISDLYLQCHTLTYVKSRSRSDPKVNICLDSALEREQEWSRKKSTIVKCDDLWQKIKGLPGHQLKNETKKELRHECSQGWSSHIQSLVVQGRFLDLIKLESKCTVWKSLVYNLPHKVAKFLMNSVIDTLNTNANLCRWGKKISDKCKHCGNKETLHHVLNSCQTALQDGRFTWRHDNLLRYLIDLIHEGIKKTEAQIFADLDDTPFKTIGASTIPNECTQTNLRPDICVLWKNLRKILLFELSVPFELNIDKAHDYKTQKYTPLLTDLEENGYDVTLICLEIGSRGFVSQGNEARLRKLLSVIDRPVKFKTVRHSLSKLATISSFVIYSAKNEPSWDVRAPLQMPRNS